jgi:hypothetical protein
MKDKREKKIEKIKRRLSSLKIKTNMKQQIRITLLFWLASSGLFGQEVKISFPQLADREVKIYYFAGEKVDSVVSVTDAKGTAVLKIPLTGYCGMAFLTAGNTGGIEMIVCGKETKISCARAELNIETVDFSASEENTLLKRVFTEASRNRQHQAWLEAATPFYDAGHSFYAAVRLELDSVRQATGKMEAEVAQSPLYATRYYALNGFMNRLFEADRQADQTEALAIQQEMETSLDIASLYRSGLLWGSVHNYYISLFNRTGKQDKHSQYAKSILRTLDRLSPPLYEAYLAGCIAEMERFNWLDSRDTVIAHTLLLEKTVKLTP